jgi:methionine-rich copper-binding protein CopC
MDPKQSLLRVFDAGAAQVDRGDSRVYLGSISVSLDPAKMRDGVYTVKWNTLSADDGDAADGAFQFTLKR